MSNAVDFDEEASKRSNAAPYSGRHPVPTVSGYHKLKEERENKSERPVTPSSDSNTSPRSVKSSKRKSLLSSAKGLLRTGSVRSVSKSSITNDSVPYRAENRNENGHALKPDEHTPQDCETSPSQSVHTEDHAGSTTAQEVGDDKAVTEGQRANRDDIGQPGQDTPTEPSPEKYDKADKARGEENEDIEKPMQDTSEAVDSAQDPRQKRKNMKQKSRDSDTAERQVTDPVTHLPIAIHDSTNEELGLVPENIPPPDTELRSATGLHAKNKDSSELDKETEEQALAHKGMRKLFPPPNFDTAKEEIAAIYRTTVTFGLLATLSTSLLLLVGVRVVLQERKERHNWPNVLMGSCILLVVGLSAGCAMTFALKGWLNNRVYSVWDDHIWEAARQQELESSKSKTPESVQWLNSLLTSLWGLINPDLFTSLMDTVEDVMQASLPKLVRMVSVEDLGQGSESIQILGVRWLPTGAAAMSISQDGKAKEDRSSDRKVPGEGEVAENSKADERDDVGQASEQDESIAEGMEAEEGDFVNIEIAFSYRASTSGRKLADKTKNAHLFLGFYLPGGLKFPVWVELRGMIGTMRLRLQLTPDPPFFSLCTLTFLGQPKVDLSCIPLTKKGLNIMDLPLISSFVQSSIDAALAEYVAPKSLTLDLKSMLVGDDFKKDTVARGVLIIKIRQGKDFKQGDSSMLGLGDGSSDPYVAVGWAKFGKTLWSTRIIMAEMQPVWEETAFVLVTPEELNAKERLRVQLWDSDRGSADDDLGRIEVDLKEIMTNSKSNGRMWDRTDGFQALNDSEKMPGTLDWSLGYFPKSRIQEEQIQKQQVEPEIRRFSQLKERVSKDADRKLREATDRNETRESDQQKAQDLKEREDAMIISTPPLHDYPAGIFAIQIHQISGLEYDQHSKSQDTGDDEEEGAGDLPSSYCTVMLNHQKVFRTRTKPKNAKPFFNAGTERFIKDFRSTEVMVSVRDSRVHENDALLGVVHLPLGKVLKHRAQIVENYPLVGGVGHGRIRISMLFRSVQVQLPNRLLGWDYGTVQITKPVTSSDLPSEISDHRLKLRTSVNRGKMYPSQSEGGQRQWKGKRDRLLCLAIRKRYSSCIVLEFRKNKIGMDKTIAFGALWLKEIPDRGEVNIDVPIWRYDKDKMKRITNNAVQEGERLGVLKLAIKFQPGLGPYHKKLASKSPDLQDVFEVLQTAHENREVNFAVEDDDDTDSSSDSDTSESDGDHDVNDGKGGPIKQMKHYKQHSDQLHRQERGVMQWKGARTADYLKTKAEHGKEHVLDKFRHHDREPGIETEV